MSNATTGITLPITSAPIPIPSAVVTTRPPPPPPPPVVTSAAPPPPPPPPVVTSVVNPPPNPPPAPITSAVQAATSRSPNVIPSAVVNRPTMVGMNSNPTATAFPTSFGTSTPGSDSNANSSTSGGMPAGTVITLVVVLLGVAVLAVAGIVFYIRKKNSKPDTLLDLRGMEDTAPRVIQVNNSQPPPDAQYQDHQMAGEGYHEPYSVDTYPVDAYYQHDGYYDQDGIYQHYEGRDGEFEQDPYYGHDHGEGEFHEGFDQGVYHEQQQFENHIAHSNVSAPRFQQ